MDSKIAVVIPNYNLERFLEGALKSCLNQTLKADEIVVIDDGSRIDPTKICDSLGVRCVRALNGGVSCARNLGATLTKSEYLLFLDADDKLLPHALMELKKALLAGDYAVSYGMVIERRSPGLLPKLNSFGYAAGNPPKAGNASFWRNTILTPGAALIKRSIHDYIGGFVDKIEYGEDRDYFVKCGLSASIVFCDTVVLDKTWRPDRMSAKDAGRILDRQRAQRALRLWTSERRLDGSWIPTDREILYAAINEAISLRLRSIYPELWKDARSCGVFHRGLWLRTLGRSGGRSGSGCIETNG